MTPEILFLLVNFRNEAEVSRFVREQLLPQLNVRLTMLICDNGSTDPESFQRELEAMPGVRYLACGKNLGYLGAARFGMEQYLSEGHALPDWVVVSNTDVSFSDPKMLHRFFTTALGALVAAPAVHSTLSGHQQNPFSEGRYPLARLKFLRFIYSSYVLYWCYQTLAYLKRALQAKGRPVGPVRDVYALHGTFLAFSRSFFQRGGHFRFGAFLFGEELFVAEQVYRMQSACRFIPSEQLEHREHASTGRYKSPRLVKYLRESTDYLIREVYRG